MTGNDEREREAASKESADEREAQDALKKGIIIYAVIEAIVLIPVILYVIFRQP